MWKMLTRFPSRVPGPLWMSIFFHAAVVAVFFLVPGLFTPAPAEVQTARILAEPVADPPLEELPPPDPARDHPDEPPPDLTPDLSEQPPDEPPLDDMVPLPPLDDFPPVPDTPVLRPSPPERAIALEPLAPSPVVPPPVAPPPPPAVPRPTKPEPERHLNRKPDYPPRAVKNEWQGRVLLLVEVLPDGSVGSIDVKESSGHDILDRAALAAVRNWTFRPATAQGQPVRSWLEVPINFRLEE